MKNKTFYSTLLILTSLFLASCAGSRSGYGNHRKGYGCPATATIKTTSAGQVKI
jgi:hypothetical protein